LDSLSLLPRSEIVESRIEAVFLIALIASTIFAMPPILGTRQIAVFQNEGTQDSNAQINNMLSSMVSSSYEVPSSHGYYLFLSNSPNAKASASDSESVLQSGLQISPLNSLPVNPSQGYEIVIVRQGETGPVYVIIQQQQLQGNAESNQISPLALAFSPLLGVWLDSERRRSRFRIYVEILELMKERPLTPYEVAFHLRLNRKKAREHLDFLVGRGFLKLVDDDDEKKLLFEITQNGRTFVDNLRAVLQQQDNFG
jgi:predicted transcriptional regulator